MVIFARFFFLFLSFHFIWIISSHTPQIFSYEQSNTLNTPQFFPMVVSLIQPKFCCYFNLNGFLIGSNPGPSLASIFTTSACNFLKPFDYTLWLWKARHLLAEPAVKANCELFQLSGLGDKVAFMMIFYTTFFRIDAWFIFDPVYCHWILNTLIQPPQLKK